MTGISSMAVRDLFVTGADTFGGNIIATGGTLSLLGFHFIIRPKNVSLLYYYY